MLESHVLDPTHPVDGDAVVVLMHGRGASPSDLAPLRRVLPDRVSLVLPRAPHPGLPWGYGPGWAWYRYEGGTRPEVESFRASQAALEELLRGLPDLLGYRPGPIVLGGFSQGGTMALAHALQNPGIYPAVLVFSGFLADHPDVSVTPGSVEGTAIWWGHGTADPAVRHDWAVEGRARLVSAGAELEARDYPMGHGISPDELHDAVEWLEARIATAA
jgi:phospholipase/carboxylesterase